MSRLKDLREYIDNELNSLDVEKRVNATAHLYGVSLAATILAKKRGLNEELAAMAGMLHDLHAYKSGSYDDHAHLGAGLARNILEKLDLTTMEETDTICSAIYHHDDKLVVDAPMDELLKDADVIDHCFKDTSKAIIEKEQQRYNNLCNELSL
ncbi:HD domain-containing protein [Pseudobutyrivibrio sp. YE44]|uniref:HD domain-containing protein n=1 Tax=Pseudobutyrivibrio sp. YE44 TaxID=1520802 RepID=UPI00088EE441|nr:HD domain-containing protein [Pseudobutyrivibrio sp. YE44]SDB57423.1 HD domain-containing protein [Pseudobutyrivibrio sp. YE44]